MKFSRRKILERCILNILLKEVYLATVTPKSSNSCSAALSEVGAISHSVVFKKSKAAKNLVE